MALSLSPSPKSMRICFESEPQMPVSSGRMTNQSGRERLGVGQVLEAHRRVGQVLQQPVRAGGRGEGLGRVPNTSAFTACLRSSASSR